MLGIDRKTFQALWTLFLFLLVLLIAYRAGRTILIFALALIFAHLLYPVVSFVERRFPPKIPKVVALGIVYVAFIGALIGIMIPLVSRISVEAATLVKKLPEFVQSDPLAHIPIPRFLEPFREQVTAFIRDRFGDLGNAIGPLLTQAGTHILSGLGDLLPVILIPILSFFFLKDGTVIRDSIVDIFPPERRALVDNIFADVHLLLAQYIRALVLLSLSTFTFYAIFLAISGGPYPILLAGFAAMLEFIPVVGPLTASVTIIAVTAASNGHILVTVIFLGVYRIFQDYVLSPYLMSAGVEVHPLLVLFGVLAGEQLLGVPGMFFSVPAIAVVRMIIIRLRRRRAI